MAGPMPVQASGGNRLCVSELRRLMAGRRKRLALLNGNAGSNEKALFRCRSADLRDELQRAHVIRSRGAERVLQAPADAIDAAVVAGRRAACAAGRNVRPRGAAVVRI